MGLVLCICLWVLWGLSSFASAGSSYCAVPPFLSTNIKPNVVLVMDYSGSMQFPAYYECVFGGYYASKAAHCGDEEDEENGIWLAELEYDNSYSYYGYFDSNACYAYSFTGRYWYESGCDCSANGGRGTTSCLSGNFLNALLMTRIDIALKALIGGKADCDDTYCYLRPQGSRRYLDDEDLHCRYYVRLETYYNSSPDYSSQDILFSIIDHNGSCELGEFFGRYARIRIPKEEREGIIQRNFDRLNISLLVFANDGREGEVRYSFYENDLDELLEVMQNEVPYHGTPTGEALYEAYDFLKQSDEHSYESNSSFIDRASEKDPYYEQIEDKLFSVPCRKSFVLLISDGEWNGDEDPDEPAYYLHTQDLREDLPDNQTAEVYTLYVFSESEFGMNSMRTVAAWGSFEDKCDDGVPYDFRSVSDNSSRIDYPRPHCDPGVNYEECCSEWDKDGDGVPDNFYAASSGSALENALNKIFGELISNVSSGTSVTTAQGTTNRTGNSVNMIQAVFYPQKTFMSDNETRVLTWSGYLYTWWFYNKEKATNIREDSIVNKALDVCNLDGSDGGDYILDFVLGEDSVLKINVYQSKSDGTPSNLVATYSSLDETIPVWEAGGKLLEKAPSNRRIYTYVDNSTPGLPKLLTSFSELASDLSKSHLLGNEDDDNLIDEDDESTVLLTKPTTVSDLVDYISGVEVSGFRTRLINSSQVWKLGDIVYSTPQVVNYSTLDLADYDVVFVGANDGMLHAFRLGRRRYNELAPHQIAKICNDKDMSCMAEKLGEELWAFIPKHSLPYLRFLMDPNYCHLYYVDLSPTIYSLDLNNDGRVDKVILIGGMRLGGAVGCSGDRCVNPPADTCPDPAAYDPGTDACIGLSSYFALDVTDPQNPKFLWEYAHPSLGFSYSGPALVKKDGVYYVVFLSGPTNYRGESGQPLRVFVLRMTPQFLIQESYVLAKSIFPDNAFGGRLDPLNGNFLDLDHDGNTDALFFGVTRWDESSADWKGNVMVMKITSDDPTEWVFEKIFAVDLPTAITSRVSFSSCFKFTYIYFGTGRYFYKEDDPGLSESDVEYLYGIRVDPCLKDLSVSCSVNESSDICSDITSSSSVVAWKEVLDSASDVFFKERSITDPTVTEKNTIFFTTMEPTSNPCDHGARSRLWEMNCATGESLSSQECPGYKVTDLKGSLFLQLSGGNIEQIYIDLAEDENPFTERNNKATPWMVGAPPEASTPFIPPGATKQGQIIYWIER